MYSPTPNQIQVFWLKASQGRYYEKNEIFAGIFRANTLRECEAVWINGNKMSGFIYVDDEGNCYVTNWKDIYTGIFVFTADKDDMHQEQNKIQSLKILVDKDAVDPSTPETKKEENSGIAGTINWPLPAETVEKLILIWPNISMTAMKILTSLIHYPIIWWGIHKIQEWNTIFGIVLVFIGVEWAVLHGGAMEIVSMTFKIFKK